MNKFEQDSSDDYQMSAVGRVGPRSEVRRRGVPSSDGVGAGVHPTM